MLSSVAASSPSSALAPPSRPPSPPIFPTSSPPTHKSIISNSKSPPLTTHPFHQRRPFLRLKERNQPILASSLSSHVLYLSFLSAIIFTSCARLSPSLPPSLSSCLNWWVRQICGSPGLTPSAYIRYTTPFFNPSHFFTSFGVSNARFFHKVKGIFLNTFEKFKSDTISALNNGRVFISISLPPVLPIGLLEPKMSKRGKIGKMRYGCLLSWVDDQSARFVVFISFGNRIAMSKDQIRKLEYGLERSGCAFNLMLF